MKFDGIKSKWASLPKWAKWTIIAGVVLMGVGGGYVAMTSVKGLYQGDSRWGGNIMGPGSLSIGRAGCLLTSLTMATNSLNGQSITPADANVILSARPSAWADPSSGLNRSNLILPEAAAGLGMKVVTRLRKVTPKSPPPSVSSIKAVADAALKSGSVAIVHVSKDGDDTGDHFVLVNGHNEKGYVITDPSYGRAVQLDDNFIGRPKANGPVYHPVGIASLVSTSAKKA